MRQEEIDAIRGAMNTLDPNNDEHWDAKGAPNLKLVENQAGVKARASTLIAHGLMMTRDEAAQRRADGAAGIAPAAPPAPPPAAKARADEDLTPPRRTPFETGISLHRDLKALAVCKKNLEEVVAIIQRAPKASGGARHFVMRAEQFLIEVNHGLVVKRDA